MVGWSLKIVAAMGIAVVAAHYAGLFENKLPFAKGDERVEPATPQVFKGPSSQDLESDGPREIHIPAHTSGHFLVDVEVNGVDLSVLVDTGATMVTLSKRDARRVGFDIEWLDFTHPMQTANGVIRSAPVELSEVRIGALELYDIDARVNESPMGLSLLGMTFLERLEGYEVRDETLILRW